MKTLEEYMADNMIDNIAKQGIDMFKIAAETLINDLCYTAINPEHNDESPGYYIGYAEAQLEALYEQWSEDYEIDEQYDFYALIIDLAKELELAREEKKNQLLELARAPR